MQPNTVTIPTNAINVIPTISYLFWLSILSKIL